METRSKVRKRRKDYGSRTFPYKCPRCGEMREEHEFPPSKSSPSGRFGYCLECKRAYGREYARRYKETPKGQEKDLRRSLALSGATREWWDSRMEECQGLCEICLKPPKKYPRLSIDHNHKTGEPRGLLCKDCNNAIGLMGDDPETIARAVKYLENRGNYSDRNALVAQAVKIAREVAPL